jgi:photosystem II stability/assembly factor-like uncharacterized protein
MTRLRIFGVAGIALLPHLLFGAAKDMCYLRDASAPSATTAYVLCEQGQLYATTDAGATWTTYKTGATETVRAVAFSSAKTGYVVGDSGTIMFTVDGGKTWQPRDSGTKENLLTVYALGNEAWIGGFDGVILYSADSGLTWNPQDSVTSMGIEDIYFADPQHGWAVGWSGTLLRTTNGGKLWEPISAGNATWTLESVYFKDLQNGWATGFDGELLRSRDGGLTWTAQQSPVAATLSSIAADKSNRLWVAAEEQLLVSDNGGDSWRAVPIEYKLFLNKMLPVGNTLWAVGELGVMSQSGSGLEWKHLDSLVTASAHIAESLDANTFKSADDPNAGK